MNGFNQMPPLFAEAIQLFQRGDLAGAEARCKRLIKADSRFFPAQDVLGNIYLRRGAFAQAEAAFTAALKLQPANVDIRVNLAVAQFRQGRDEAAEASARQALSQAPGNLRALSVLGPILRNLNRFAEAVEIGRAALAANPKFPPAYADLGAALEGLERHGEALACYEDALRLAPDFAEAWCAKGNALNSLGRHDEAEAAFRRAVGLAPGNPGIQFSFGIWNQARRRWEQAAQCFVRALEARPDYAEAACHLGAVLHSLNRLNDAAEAYRRALAAKPDSAAALVGLGALHLEAGHDAEALDVLSRAYGTDPMAVDALAFLILARLQTCSWDGFDAEREALFARLRADEDKTRVNPFVAILAGADSAALLPVARRWAKGVTPSDAPMFSHAPVAVDSARRLRVGYLSADFREHPMAHLMTGVFETHDRSKVELHGYALGPDDDGPMRNRIRAAFEYFTVIGGMAAEDAARRIQADGIDILVDLMGYTNHGNPTILAYRPAPIQVNFQGYAATMGAAFMDYLVADPVTIPLSERPFFDERIVHLPHSYHPNAVTRVAQERTPSRAECGLPAEGFVFCCFNNANKFTREVFAVWMRLLHSVPGSVLWLLDRSGAVKDSMMAEIAAHGIDAGRVVFAPRVPLPEHLARHRLADLFLDTLPYNAHTTASDALWMGLPVLTCLGRSFAGRVAASLLLPLGLDGLVTHSLEEYEATARMLAGEPERLAGLRRHLVESKATSPIFDTALYTRHLESAYLRMWETWQAGKAPESFAVPA